MQFVHALLSLILGIIILVDAKHHYDSAFSRKIAQFFSYVPRHSIHTLNDARRRIASKRSNPGSENAHYAVGLLYLALGVLGVWFGLILLQCMKWVL